MATKRTKRSKEAISDTDAILKNRKFQRGLFVYDIPTTVLIAEFKSRFNTLEVFIPTFKEHHMGLGYIVFHSNMKIEIIFKELNSLGIMNSYQFDPSKNWSVNRAVSEVQSVTTNLKNLTNAFSLPNLQTGTILQKNKQRLFRLLAENYNEIIESYHFLEKNIVSTESQDNTNQCIWLVIFSLCYFIAYKLSNETFIQYEKLYISFEKPLLSVFVERLITCNHVQRYLAIDFLWQLTIMDNQFKYENEVIACLIDSPTVRPNQLETFSPSFSSLVFEILQTDLVNNLIALGIDYREAVLEFVPNIYLTILPESIQGFTLFSRYVVIKKKCKDLKDFENEPALRGYTLMTILHEYAHFAQRVLLTSNIQWLNHESPEFTNSTDLTKIHEAGSEFMIKLFGYEPVAINIKASNFIFDIRNWHLELRKFQNQFKSLNQNIAINLVMNGRTSRQRLRESTNPASLIGCIRRDRSI